MILTVVLIFQSILLATFALDCNAKSSNDEQKNKPLELVVIPSSTELQKGIATYSQNQALVKSLLHSSNSAHSKQCLSLGVYLAAHNQNAQAIELLDKALSLNNKNARAAGILGLVYFKTKKLEKAEVYLERACRLGLDKEFKRTLEKVKALIKYQKKRQREGDFQRPVGSPVSFNLPSITDSDYEIELS